MSASLVGLGGAGALAAIAAKIADATGVTITVTTAGTPVPLLSATLLLQDQDLSGGGLAFNATTGVFSVAKDTGVGKYLAIALVGDCKGGNAKKPTAQWFAKEGGVAAAAKGSRASKTEPATAVDGNMGVASAILNLSAIGDTAELRLDSTTNGDTVLVKHAHLVLFKLSGA